MAAADWHVAADSGGGIARGFASEVTPASDLGITVDMCPACFLAKISYTTSRDAIEAADSLRS
ncbi:hypothetical protein SGFS_021380 [Streptomyces graminofaciens]|uniref:Uncharacterized protein n=1 Tax=Streptomyces graminofaciens TaxID=68212 RepID=A0ABM7F4Q2_9ACTN|nr:hypothetical protein SGFS_021380 [Streptomyces graminofaciens]